jgi:hypothetical protein
VVGKISRQTCYMQYKCDKCDKCDNYNKKLAAGVVRRPTAGDHEGRPYGDCHGLNRLLGPDYSEFDLCCSFYLEVPEVETGEDQKE